MHQHRTASLIRKTFLFLMATLLAGLALDAIPLPVARAAEFNVGCNVTELINTIDTANGNGVPDIIELTAVCTYTLTTVDNNTDGLNGLPSITSEIAIRGNGATIERSSEGGTPQFRIFHVASTGALTLTNVTLTNGHAGESLGGGGIYSQGALYISDSAISDNAATYGGGGVRKDGGTLNISRSTLCSNAATYGGGIYNKGGTAAVDISDSTICSNTATAFGGGILNNLTLNIANSTFSANIADQGGGVLNNGGALDISNSTFYGNTATSGAGIDNTFGATVGITNTIVAGNTGGSCVGTIASGGYNIESANTCGLSATGDITSSTTITTTLGPLQYNGGPTWTHALLADSPAIDHIPYTTNGCGITYTADQRGYERPCPTEGSCDIGAYEEHALFGDVNCDCDVDIEDIMLVASHWRCRSGDDCYDDYYDLDKDGDVDIVDIMLVSANWGDAC